MSLRAPCLLVTGKTHGDPRYRRAHHQQRLRKCPSRFRPLIDCHFLCPLCGLLIILLRIVFLLHRSLHLRYDRCRCFTLLDSQGSPYFSPLPFGS
ncbi:hypothetical protein CC86DRAFT_18103 [Ophiobolus disseminans]|uniref:Uncharacterized protein n=1 Tax=Ophiobolus disseminans TaxID=1469910 RepID=A0A6A7ALJ3_9PLEO|nr:hypothetical protein CC86DRAFT_18103 [Ophiobolus disseminans]